MLKWTFVNGLILFVCNLFWLLPPTLPATEAATSPAKLLITPLWFHSPEDLTFLNRGILEMLATRLPREGRIAVVQGPKAPQDDNDALKMAAKQEADYVLTGGVTLFDNKVSTDLRLLEADSGRIALQFSRFGRRPGDVLDHIDALANEVVSLLTGGEERSRPQKPDSPRVETVAPQTAKPRTDAQAAPAASMNWRSQPLDLTVNSLAAADMDGKGGTDLAAAGDQHIRLMTLAGHALSPLAQWEIPAYERILSLDAADLNGNGPAELYVTCLDQHQRLKSFVLEWREGRLAILLENLPWFFRIIASPGRPPRLLGQKQRLVGDVSAFEMNDPSPFLAGIYPLTWRQGRLMPGDSLPVPEAVNVFGLSEGSLFDSGSTSLAAYDERDRIALFSGDGSSRWHSSEPFGGSETYLKIPSGLSRDQAGRFYLPHRLLLTDLNQDGRHELAAASNSETGKRRLERYRRYTRGKVVILSWNGATMKPVWETDPLEGYISDMAVVPPSGRQPGRLIIALVDKDKTDGSFSGRKTWIVEQEMDQTDFKF